MQLNYIDAHKKVCTYLQDIPNIKKFCDEHKLDYHNVIKIKNNNNNCNYPKLISKLLRIFGNDVTINVIFEIKKIKK